MSSEQNFEEDCSRREQIQFGSTICLELHEEKDFYLHSEGFILSKLVLKSFADEKGKKSDFNYCNFKIVPFQSESNFKTQIAVITKLIEKIHDFHSHNLELRRKDINEYKQNLDNEFMTNWTQMEKAKGTPIFLITSTFQLVHAVSHKFLSLNSDDEKKLFFELVDYPNDKSFFKFFPSLKLQNQRKEVFSDDPVVICSTKMICNNRNPCIYTPHNEIKAQSNLVDLERKNTDDFFEKDIEDEVIGNIERISIWKVKLFSSDEITSCSTDFLLEHDALCLILSEKQFCLSAIKSRDPYEQLFEKISLNIGINTNLLEVDKNIMRHKSISVDSGLKNMNNSYYSQEEEVDGQIKDKDKDINLEYYDLKNSKSSFQLQSSCLWKIEGKNPQKGGIVQWDIPYRLRHFTSGKYLRVNERPNVDDFNKKFSLELTNNLDDYTLFYFEPFHNLLLTEQHRKNVGKDAFLKIQNLRTNLWISFNENFENATMVKEYPSTSNYPVCLSRLDSDMNTFKIRRADYNEIWEISFLLHVLPMFNDILDAMKNNAREDGKSYYQTNFLDMLPQVIHTLENLTSFVKNLIHSNISIFEEYGKISYIRQTILREQSILGMLCWMLYKSFPTEEEIKRYPLDKLKHDDMLFDSKTIFYEKFVSPLLKNQSIQSTKKIEENLVKKKLRLTSHLYKLIKVCCQNNEENQNYFLKFLGFYSNHIGHTAFVSDTLEACLGTNEKILKNLSNYSLALFENLDNYDSKKSKTFITNILHRFKKFNRYEKSDLLKLLAKFCSFDEETSIYKNQEIVFHTVHNDVELYHHVFMKIYSSNSLLDQRIYVELGGGKSEKGNAFSIDDILKPDNNPISEGEIEYLKQQLILFSNLCIGRNFACIDYFGKILPLKLLIKYTLNNDFKDDFRACFCLLIQNIYLDKEPRTILMKPNLVRKLELKKKNEVTKTFKNPFALFKKKSNAPKSDSNKKSYPDLPDGVSMNSPAENKQLLEMEISPAIIIEHEKEKKDDEGELASLEELKKELIIYLDEKQKNLQQQKKSAPVYNVLTLEVIKVILMMLKFGLFNNNNNSSKNPGENAHNNLNNSQMYSKDTNRQTIRSGSPFRNLNLNIFASNAIAEKSEIEKIVQYLAVLLEFDEAYFEALNDLEIKRKFEVKIDDNLLNLKFNADLMNEGFNEIKNLGKNLGKNLEGMLSGKKGKENKGKVKFAIAEKETHRNQDPLFEKINCLKRILANFSNKTYTYKQEDENIKNYEVSIKTKICELFNYLIDMREDYYIDNLMEYFRYQFIEKFRDCKDEYVKEDTNFDEILQLLPENSTQVGEKIIKGTKFKNFTKGEEFKFFDEILERPFMEVLLLSFYFSYDAKLQNSIMGLIHRSSTQKLSFYNMVNKLEILFSKEQIDVYESFNNLVQKLNVLVSNSQTWIHINESEKDEIFLAKMEKTIKKLSKIESLFKTSIKDLEFLKTKQSIFKNTGGIRIIISLIEIIELNIDPFVNLIFEENYNASAMINQSMYRASEMRFTKLGQKINTSLVYSMFKISQLCYSILGFSCQKNVKLQEYLLKHVHHPFKSNFHRKFNVNQLEFFSKLLDTSADLKNKLTYEELQYFVDLIILHGKYTDILEIFIVFSTHADKFDIRTNSENNKKILTLLFDDENISHIHPFINNIEGLKSKEKDRKIVNQRKFFTFPENIKDYQGAFIKIVGNILKLDVGMNYISKCYKNLNILDLLKFLWEKTYETKNDPFETMESSNLYIKNSIIDLLLLFFAKSSQALQDFYSATSVLLEIVKILKDQIISTESFSDDYIKYIAEKFLNLFNIYNEKFLSDLGNLIGGYSGFQNTEEELKGKEELRSFADCFLENIEKFSRTKELDPNSQLTKNVAKMTKIFNLENKNNLNSSPGVEEHIDENKSLLSSHALDKIDLNYDQTEEDLGNEEISVKEEENKTRPPKAKFGTNLLNIMKNKIRGISKLIMVQSETHEKHKYLSLPKLDEENSYSAQSLSQFWNIFKYFFQKSEKIEKSIKDEKDVFTNSIMSISSIFDHERIDEKMKGSEKMEILLNSDDLILKFLHYLEFWKSRHAEKSYIIFLLQILDRIIKQKEELSSEQEEIQNMFDRLNTTKILLILIWEDSEHDTSFLYYLFKFFVSLLFGGNRQVQKTIYNFFLSNPISEKFFRKMHNLIMNEISIYHNKKSNEEDVKKRKVLLPKILRLLQLFCEGHNQDLQNYLRAQKQSKNNYDMITTTVHLLLSFKISNMNYDTISQCFDTLTEYIQGPCKENQMAIVDSKFLEYAVNVLSEEEKIFETIEFKPQRSLTKSETTNLNLAERRPTNMTFEGSPSNVNISNSSPNLYKTHQNKSIHPGRLARIKMKCLVTIVSLLECNDSKDNIAIRIRRALPFGVLKNNLIRIYELYKKKFQEEYSMKSFGLGDEKIKIDSKKDPETYELIIENGFNIYILLNLLVDGSDENDESEEVNEFLEMFQEESNPAAGFFKNNIFGEFSKLGSSVFGLGAGLMKNLKKNVIDKTFKLNQETDEIKQIQEKIEKKQIQQEALNFFKKNIAHIEIVRDNKLYRVFFPLLPTTRFLPKSLKNNFHEKVNRNSTKNKINDLMHNKDLFVRTMIHEEKLNKLFNKNKFIGLIFNHEKLWKDLAFLTNLVINGIIIASYSEYYPSLINFAVIPSIAINDARKYEPRFFLQGELDSTLIVIVVIGISNIVFSGLVVLFFLLKRAPLILEEKEVWDGFFEMKINRFKKLLVVIMRCFYSLFLFASDFDFVYYSAYISFSILGLVVHPFLFCFHLIDFLRIDLLKNVILSIWLPRKQLILTFLILILEEYYFSLIAYIFFYDQVTAQLDSTTNVTTYYCESFWKCWMQIFDQTFKQSGAIGAAMNDCFHYSDSNFCQNNPNNLISGNYSDSSLFQMHAVSHSNKALFFARFFFDNIFFIFVVIVTISMVAGVIIDTFANLTEALKTMTKDKNGICFICGFPSEMLDKNSERGGYYSHIKNDHYMWNYIYYIAYLKQKEKTEYNGNESFVWTLSIKNDLSWFPIARALAVPDQEEEELQRTKQYEEIAQHLSILEKQYDETQAKLKKLVSMRDRKSRLELKRSMYSIN